MFVKSKKMVNGEEELELWPEGEEIINGCGSMAKSLFFCVTFMIVVSFIFLNLFIAIILDSFDTSKDEESL